MSFLHAVILGIVEGVTEFLPISSTGHLILASTLLQISESAFRSSFAIAIQLGAISAVISLYFRKVLAQPRILLSVAYAFFPTAVFGFLLYKVIKHFLLGNPAVVLCALVIGGILMLLLERWFGTRPAALTGDHALTVLSPTQAVAVGLCQTLAIIPGVSRSAATIMGGLALGLPRPAIVEFSFLLAVPTMLAATGYDLFQTGITFSTREWQILAVGTVIAFFTALVAVRWLVGYVSKGTFVPFAWYRIFLGVALWVVLFV